MGIFDKFRKRKKKGYIKDIIAVLDCDCSVIEENSIDGVMARYHQALREGEKEGYTPLMIIPSEMMLEVFNTVGDKESITIHRESIVAKAKAIDVKELLKNRLDEVMPIEEDEEYDITGEFTLEEQKDYFLSIEESFNEKIILAKIPTDKPWEAAAWVPMGGFNECPTPEEQVAVFHYWYEKYGAVPALVSSDVWELFIKNPPKTQKESERLAWEQFGFSGDIVWQGAGTVNALAGSLINSSVWYFWWD